MEAQDTSLSISSRLTGMAGQKEMGRERPPLDPRLTLAEITKRGGTKKSQFAFSEKEPPAKKRNYWSSARNGRSLSPLVAGKKSSIEEKTIKRDEAEQRKKTLRRTSKKSNCLSRGGRKK